jgi:hypothetical protein
MLLLERELFSDRRQVNRAWQTPTNPLDDCAAVLKALTMTDRLRPTRPQPQGTSTKV